MIRYLLRAAFAALLIALGSTAAEATVNCTMNSAGIAFGTFTGSQITVTGTITLTCTGTGSYSYTLKLSTGGAGVYSPRHMFNGANTLNYNIYKDSARSQIWGDGTGGSTILTGTVAMKGATTLVINNTMYAKLPAQSLPPFGSYMDTITATLVVSGNTTTTMFPVTADIQSLCSISASDLLFGSYTGTQLDNQSQISVTCASGVSWNIGLNAGTFAGATVATRKMTGPGGTSMNYSLFRNSSRTLNWGNTIGTDTLSGTGTGTVQALPVYGRVPASQTLPTGGYQDTIVATLTF